MTFDDNLILCIIGIRYLYMNRQFRHIGILSQIILPGLTAIIAVLYLISIQQVAYRNGMGIGIIYTLIRFNCNCRLTLCRSVCLINSQSTIFEVNLVIASSLNRIASSKDCILSRILSRLSCKLTVILDLIAIVRFHFTFVVRTHSCRKFRI